MLIVSGRRRRGCLFRAHAKDARSVSAALPYPAVPAARAFREATILPELTLMALTSCSCRLRAGKISIAIRYDLLRETIPDIVQNGETDHGFSVFSSMLPETFVFENFGCKKKTDAGIKPVSVCFSLLCKIGQLTVKLSRPFRNASILSKRKHDKECRLQ